MTQRYANNFGAMSSDFRNGVKYSKDDYEDEEEEEEEEKHVRKEDKAKTVAKEGEEYITKMNQRMSERQVMLSLGEERINNTKKHFKIISFEAVHNHRNLKLEYYYAHPRSESHMISRRGTFAVPYTGVTTENLKNMFSDKKVLVNQTVTNYMRSKVGKDVDRYYSETETSSVIVCTLDAYDVTSTSPDFAVPMNVFVEGVNSEYAIPHYVSTNPKEEPLTVLTPGTGSGRKSIYSNDVVGIDDLQSIHGAYINPDKRYASDGGYIGMKTSEWGTSYNGVVDVDMTKGIVPWLLYKIFRLLLDYKNKSGSDALPKDMSKATFDKLKKFSEKHPAPDIYDPSADFTDNYIGKVLEILTEENVKKKIVLWTIGDSKLVLRMPLQFIEFCTDQINTETQAIRIANPGSLNLRTKTMNVKTRRDPDDFDTLVFSVDIRVFRPHVWFMATPVEEKSQAVDDDEDDDDDGR